ncbi:MAG: nickel pincer cofactor biosynthesis protein LarC [Treponema sp.]|jgi:uncharacterized protein (TIGR00299 family) protein|nr:nickel pincer cofactor biosynthesis protein LarC [Treponema sp.]
MKTLHFDCFSGVAGDMALGALVDLGADPDIVRAELDKLGLGGWKLTFVRDQRCGIGGIRAAVDLEAADPGHQHTHPGHEHRSWKDIRTLLEGSNIRLGAKKRALDIFTRLAQAESQVHGVPIEDIGFHEVGALDSIIDIVGTAICLDLLGPDRITCGEIELGGGFTQCAHGQLPVPAPATLLLLQGMPVKTGGFQEEMTTPTGAAIIASQVDEFTSEARFWELKTAYGIGTRNLDRPNALRVSWRETGTAAGAEPEGDLLAEELILLEANIDDMSGEELGFLMERLFEAGALDVTLSPCVMKKSRPGTLVSALIPPARLADLRRTMFRGSTTIGFRESPVRRLALRREAARITASFGEARTKRVFYEGRLLREKIEYEDRARLAREQNCSLAEAEAMVKQVTNSVV